MGLEKPFNNRIALAIRHAEDDMREHDRQLQQFINHLHSYLLTIAGELRAIPRKQGSRSRIVGRKYSI